ncbi:MAG: 3'-5' exonuclease [Chloroflexi bacterium]|nr:3'-5' exonuclease [Chloroflexota bacterium]
MNRAYAKTKAINTAKEKLEMRPVFLDTETTGLDKKAEIVDIAIIDFDGTVLLDSLVKPKRKIPRDATKVHGITNKMVKDAPTWENIFPKVKTILSGRIVGIYNAEFDIKMLKQSTQIYGLKWIPPYKDHFCIMKLYAEYFGDWDDYYQNYKWQKLESASRQMQISFPNSHRALDDTLIAWAVFLQMADYNDPKRISKNTLKKSNRILKTTNNNELFVETGVSKVLDIIHNLVGGGGFWHPSNDDIISLLANLGVKEIEAKNLVYEISKSYDSGFSFYLECSKAFMILGDNERAEKIILRALNGTNLTYKKLKAITALIELSRYQEAGDRLLTIAVDSNEKAEIRIEACLMLGSTKKHINKAKLILLEDIYPKANLDYRKYLRKEKSSNVISWYSAYNIPPALRKLGFQQEADELLASMIEITDTSAFDYSFMANSPRYVVADYLDTHENIEGTLENSILNLINRPKSIGAGGFRKVIESYLRFKGEESIENVPSGQLPKDSISETEKLQSEENKVWEYFPRLGSEMQFADEYHVFLGMDDSPSRISKVIEYALSHPSIYERIGAAECLRFVDDGGYIRVENIEDIFRKLAWDNAINPKYRLWAIGVLIENEFVIDNLKIVENMYQELSVYARSEETKKISEFEQIEICYLYLLLEANNFIKAGVVAKGIVYNQTLATINIPKSVGLMSTTDFFPEWFLDVLMKIYPKYYSLDQLFQTLKNKKWLRFLYDIAETKSLQKFLRIHACKVILEIIN